MIANEKMRKCLNVFVTVLMVLCLSACGISSKQAKEILQENGYDFNSVKVVATKKLSNSVKGLTDKGNKYVLLEIENSYYVPCAINKKNRSVISVARTYPYNLFLNEISKESRATNFSIFKIECNYIKEFGIDCFSDREYAEKILQDITNKNIVSIGTAQEKIIENAREKIGKGEDVTVIFNDDSAVPKYYIAKTEKMSYNWGGVLPEDVYGVWNASTDSRTQSIMSSLYGQPYAFKSFWEVLDSDLNEVGTYRSLEQAKTAIYGKSSKSDTTKKSENNRDTKTDTSVSDNNKEGTVSNSNSPQESDTNATMSSNNDAQDKQTANKESIKTHYLTTLVSGDLHNGYFRITQNENVIYYYNNSMGAIECVNMISGSTARLMNIEKGTVLSYQGTQRRVDEIDDMFYDKNNQSLMITVRTSATDDTGPCLTLLVNVNKKSTVREIPGIYGRQWILGTDNSGAFVYGHKEVGKIMSNGEIESLWGPSGCFVMVNSGNNMYFLKSGAFIEYDNERFITLFRFDGQVLGANTSSVVAYSDGMFRFYNYRGLEMGKINKEEIEIKDGKSFNISENGDQQIFVSSNGDIVFYDKSNKALRKISKK